MNLSNYKKILIIRLSSLGDILLTTPLLRSIKTQYPHLTIDFIVRSEFQDTIVNNPYINRIYKLQKDYNFTEVRSEIILNKYDLIVDLQNNLRSKRFTRGVSEQIVRYRKPYLKRILLVKFKINKLKEIIPIPVRYANSISNFELDDKGLELFLPENLNPKLNSDDKFIGFCPGSRHKTKMWPEKYFVELGNRLVKENFRIVLFGGLDDNETCARITKEIPGALNLSNKNDLLELAANMKRCKAIICNDSGLMHTSLAVDVPVISIFGSTVKELGFFPYKGRKLVLENNSLSCRPCSHIGLDECPEKHLKCMNEITPSLVFNQAIEFIKVI